MVDDSIAKGGVPSRHHDTASEIAAAQSARIQSALWTISLHSAAARRWLACDPPRLDEVDKTLEAIGSVGLITPVRSDPLFAVFDDDRVQRGCGLG